MHPVSVCVVKKEDNPLLSLSLINRMQHWILGFPTVYLCTSCLTMLLLLDFSLIWTYIYFQDLKKTSQKPNLESLLFLYWTNCPLWKSKEDAFSWKLCNKECRCRVGQNDHSSGLAEGRPFRFVTLYEPLAQRCLKPVMWASKFDLNWFFVSCSWKSLMRYQMVPFSI